MSLKEQIRSWMANREDELVEALTPLIAVDSTITEAKENAPFGEGNVKALEAALALAEKWGFQTENVDNYVGTADLNDLPDKLHILAHLDIVSVGDGWDTDPFTLVRDGDIIYGRGVNDDKGPAVAALLAMRCVRELGLPLTGNAKLLFGTDEETGSRDMAHYYSRRPFAPCAVTPDANFPVTNVEKARYAPTFGASWENQPMVKGHLMEVDGGVRINVVPAGCTAKICGLTAAEAMPALETVMQQTGVEFECTEAENVLTIQATGIQAHAAHFDGSRNAVTGMLEALALLPLAEDEAAKAVRQLHAFFPFADTAGEAMGIAQRDEISGALTLVLSILKLNENGFTARFDSRDSITATKETTQNIVEAKMNALGWSCTGSFHEGHYVDEDSDFIRALLLSYEEFTGKKGFCQSTGGGTYVHEIPGGVAFGLGVEDFNPRAHGANERQRISDLIRGAEIYAAVIARVCG